MDMIKIGQFLAQLRKERGLTQAALGDKIGVTNKTVSRWETGTYLPPVEMLMELSALYDVSINELLSGQRLSEAEYKEYAEENMKAALTESSFTLKEKMAYFQTKWKREHRAGFVAALVLGALLFAVGVIRDNGLQLIGVLWISAFLVVQNNRMMAYVEQRAFDGSGRQ